jgi:hypothetical protein
VRVIGRSRYIDAGTDTQGDITYKMHEHYMFIEAEHNPEQAPVLLWSNGGVKLPPAGVCSCCTAAGTCVMCRNAPYA